MNKSSVVRRSVGRVSMEEDKSIIHVQAQGIRCAQIFATHVDLWVYSVQHDPASRSPWLPCYSFGDLEFLSGGFDIMNYHKSTRPRSLFTQTVICERYTYFMEDDVIVGSITVNGNSLKKKRHGLVQTTETLESESDKSSSAKSEFRSLN